MFEDTTYLSNHDLVAWMQGTVVSLVRKCDISPGNFECAGSPSERARIEDRRNRDSRGYLKGRQVRFCGSNGLETNFA
jgi:hypothetical protein